MKIAYLLAAFGRESVLSRKAILVFLGGRALLQNLNPQFLVSRCAASFRCVALSVMLSVFSNSVAAETIPATLHWGWMRGWGAPWGSQICGQDYSFEAADEFGCAPIAEACHPNVGQQNYSPFVGIAGCVILTSSGRLAGGGGAWYACPPGQNWTLSGTNCTRPDSTCPILALTPLPAHDACSQALENLGSTQAQKDAACGTLSQAMQDGRACLSERLSRTNNPATAAPIPLRITGDIRNLAYQAHLREIWDKMEALVVLIRDNPTMQTACAARRAEIAAEKGCDNGGPCTSCYAESATSAAIA